jgi:CIC family chloride channel protein
MGALFAAAARAPITAAIIIFELTGEYRIILPLLFAISLATGIGHLLSVDTIYTLKLRRRGIDVIKRAATQPMQLILVSAAMQPPPEGVLRDLPVRDTVVRFTNEHRDALPIVDREGHYRGTVTARQIEKAMRDKTMQTPIGNLAQAIPLIRADQTLEKALASLLDHELQGLPVVSGDGDRIVGWLSHRDVLRAYHDWSRRHERGAIPENGSRVDSR